MLRGHRCIIIAVVGWLTLAASDPNKAVQPEQTQHTKQASAALPPTPEPTESAQEPKQPDPGCDQGKEDRKSDLCAQWKAADAAKESAEWAGSTFWLGVAGAAISFLTLLAAGFAAWYARKAALHTADSVDQAERAAKAAEDTLDETRRVTAAQLRPYVSFTEPRKRDDEPFSRESNLYIAIQNFGQIPALDVRLSMGENFLVEPIKDTQIPLVVVDASYGMIAPGDKREDSIRTKNMHPSEIARAAEGKVTLFIRLRLDYDWDGGSDSHEMTLALVDPIKNDWVMVDKRRRYQIQ